MRVSNAPTSAVPLWGPCTRCGHEWRARKYDSLGRPVKPKACAACRSVYWTEPRQRPPNNHAARMRAVKAGAAGAPVPVFKPADLETMESKRPGSTIMVPPIPPPPSFRAASPRPASAEEALTLPGKVRE
jgi:hypothetical protein